MSQKKQEALKLTPCISVPSMPPWFIPPPIFQLLTPYSLLPTPYSLLPTPYYLITVIVPHTGEVSNSWFPTSLLCQTVPSRKIACIFHT